MTVSIGWITYLLFVVIRISAVVLFTPIQAIRALSVHTRLLFIFCFSFLFFSNSSFTPSSDYLALRCISEFTNGLLLALGVHAIFSIYQMAGQLMDNQLGLNSLVFFKPDEQGQESLSARLLSMLGVLFFFGSNGYLWFFKGLYYSFIIIPPGTIEVFNGFKPIMKQFSFMFSMSFIIASPIVIALLTVDLCGALITRTMPQINTYFFTLPLKIILGLIILMFMLNYFTPITDTIFNQFFQGWQELMS